MGNCTSCVSSDIQVHEYGCIDNSVHIRASINGCYKVGSVHSEQGAKGVNQDSAILYQVIFKFLYFHFISVKESIQSKT